MRYATSKQRPFDHIITVARQGLVRFEPASFLQDQNEPAKETPSRPSRLSGSTIKSEGHYVPLRPPTEKLFEY